MKTNVEIDELPSDPTEDPGYVDRPHGTTEDVPVIPPQEDTPTTPIPEGYGQDTHEYKGKVRAWTPKGR